MDVQEALCTMQEKSGLDFGRISNLADLQDQQIEWILQGRSDIRLDAFVRIVDVCGYKLLLRYDSGEFCIRADGRACKRDTDVAASCAVEQLFYCTDESTTLVSKEIGKNPDYVSRIIQNSSIPYLSVMLKIATAASCQLVIRKFRESYVLSVPAEPAELDEPSVDTIVMGLPNHPRTHASKPKGKARKKSPKSTSTKRGASQSDALFVHEVFREYYQHFK